MKVIITSNTAVRGKSIKANPDKVVDLKAADARALICAGKAYAPSEKEIDGMSGKSKKEKSTEEKAAAEKEAAEKKAAGNQ